jgi:hypothetical protein
MVDSGLLPLMQHILFQQVKDVYKSLLFDLSGEDLWRRTPVCPEHCGENRHF